MCELFAMSARHPSTVRMSLEEFSRHGGLSGANKDGWGIAWYDEGDVSLVKEALPAAECHQVRCLQDRPFVSPLVISHERKATRGAVARRNCQPFVREPGGLFPCHDALHLALDQATNGIQGLRRHASRAPIPRGEGYGWLLAPCLGSA